MDNPIANISRQDERVNVEFTEREVDTDHLRDLIHELKPTLEDGARLFVFRLEAVEFLPSACLALLLMFYQEVKNFEGRIVLLNCQENVAFLLRLARLDRVFELAEGEPEGA
ncbi:MAG: STAS domain-containing protein [Planctomycetota bacterium]